jgi:hypothetical protein
MGIAKGTRLPSRVARVGDVFGRLTVTEELPSREVGGRFRRMVRLSCACGGEKTAYVDNLRSGYTTSCGCLQVERLREALVKHDLADTPEHIIWMAMRGRCNNPNNPKHYRYGGRGIRVCEQWDRSFADFYTDMGPRPSPKHTIDRINNDGNYEPGNCRWATRTEQANNRRTSRLVSFDGRVQTLAQWARELGVPYGQLSRKMRNGTWPQS